jgi:hypothetical protein
MPSVLSSGLYAIPALIGAAVTVAVTELHGYGLASAVGAAALCFVIRMAGVQVGIDAPRPRSADDDHRVVRPTSHCRFHRRARRVSPGRGRAPRVPLRGGAPACNNDHSR